MTDEEKGCFMMIVMPVLYVVGALINAFVFWYLWGWFAVPLGAPPILYAHAAGLTVMWMFVIADATLGKVNANGNEALALLVGILFVRPALVLAFGAALQRFM